VKVDVERNPSLSSRTLRFPSIEHPWTAEHHRQYARRLLNFHMLSSVRVGSQRVRNDRQTQTPTRCVSLPLSQSSFSDSSCHKSEDAQGDIRAASKDGLTAAGLTSKKKALSQRTKKRTSASLGQPTLPVRVRSKKGHRIVSQRPYLDLETPRGTSSSS
jgi:hypothetical protein